ncbi:5'/3'-nucleotidase SurE [Longispora albida]|uniref:5'/3'-nucleotidase SurE n=1 Tax=Longispora albida TaxID=203523 RepID=UPI0003654A47|nr:5'/3'-nucleotidase SurE [Longispora albida]
MTAPLALVTNDDGIGSPGLAVLAEAAARQGWRVVIAAPASQASGTGAGVTAVAGHDGHIPITRQPDGSYAVEATPAMITLLALHGAFGGPPGIVLSGVNRGANIGRAILHSGTVGAALTAAYHGVPALAASLDVGLGAVTEPRWDEAGAITSQVLPRLRELAPGTVLNLNVPGNGRVLGLRTARLATFGTVQISLAEHGEDFVRTELTETAGEREDDDTDLVLLTAGWATITVVEAITERPPDSG